AGANSTGVRSNEARPIHNQPDRRRYSLEAVSGRLAKHHVIGVVLGEDISHVMKGSGQSRLANGISCAARALAVQEAGCGYARCIHSVVGHVNAEATQPVSKVSWGV